MFTKSYLNTFLQFKKFTKANHCFDEFNEKYEQILNAVNMSANEKHFSSYFELEKQRERGL